MAERGGPGQLSSPHDPFTPPALTPSRRVARAARLLLVPLLVVIAWLTLAPGEADPAIKARIFCIRCGPQSGVDFVLNVIFFVPLGVLLRLAALPRRRAVALCFAATLAIELLQIPIPGRITSAVDLVANTTGGAIGVALADWWRALLLPSPALARRLAAAAMVAWLAALAGTMWLFAPSLPESAYWGQIAPSLGQFDRFTGEVLGARVGGVPIRDGRLGPALSDSVRRLLLTDGTVMRVAAVPGAAPQRLAPVVSIFDGRGREIALLGQEASDGVFRVRRRAASLRLREPSVNLWGALPPDPSTVARDTVILEGWNHGWTQFIAADIAGKRQVRKLTLRPTWGWALVLPFENAYGPQGYPLTRRWVALLLLPLAFYAAQGARRREGGLSPGAVVAMAALAAAGAALGLEALPRALGVGGARPWEWQGAALGLPAGALAAVLVRLAARAARGKSPSRPARTGV